MEIETRESKINAVLANLREQGVGEDWIAKIVADANSMTERDPVVAHVRNEAMLALAAMRKRKADSAKPPSNGINERLTQLDYQCWLSMEREALLAWAATWAPGETLQTVEWFYLETSMGQRKTRDELNAYLRPPSWSRTDTWLSQFVDDKTVRETLAAAAERARLEMRS
ncbi:MAG: hypothetical protein WB580_17440 [Candidatus Binataceae bacterium]